MADRIQRCDWCDADTGRCDEDAIRSADEESVICGECKEKEDQRVQPDPKLMTAEELAAVAEGYREFGANEYPVGKLLGHIAAQAAENRQLRAERDRFALDRAEVCKALGERAHPGLSPAGNVADLVRENGGLRSACASVFALISESRGVAGLHLNGNEAPWDSLTVGEFSSWLEALEAVRGLVEKPPAEPTT